MKRQEFYWMVALPRSGPVTPLAGCVRSGLARAAQRRALPRFRPHFSTRTADACGANSVLATSSRDGGRL